jgi:3-oxoacyl-[acyl-carrier-protein] synthase-3
MATSDMAVFAAERAIKSAGVDPKDIDLVLLGTFTPDHLLPATACLVQDRLDLNCPAMDISAACAGFVYSLITGMQFIAAGTSKLVLVIGSDANTRVMNPADVKTWPLFGDGAGAVLLAPGESDQGMPAYIFGADGSGAELLCRKAGGSREPVTPEIVASGGHLVIMDGRPVFKWAIRLLVETINDVLRAAECDRDEVDLWILHQANRRIIDAAAENLGLDSDKVVIHLDRYGNTSAGSVPIAIDEAVRAGQLRRGSRVMLSGFGAGLSWGTALFRM